MDPEAMVLTPPRTPSPSAENEPSKSGMGNADGLPQGDFDLLICAMHFIGDGMALHTFANDFLGILGSQRSDSEIEEMLVSEWAERWQGKENDVGSRHLTSVHSVR
jgi:hypothetical protein